MGFCVSILSDVVKVWTRTVNMEVVKVLTVVLVVKAKCKS